MARKFIYLIGVNGAGKSTMAARLAAYCARFGITAHVDSEQTAFSPELDEQVSTMDPVRAEEYLLEQAGRLVEQWIASPAQVVVVDRWLESYDVPITVAKLKALLKRLEDAGFELYPVLLAVGLSPFEDGMQAMIERTELNKAMRTPEWWARGTGTVEERAAEEYAYQQQYRKFCASFRICQVLCTTDLDWNRHEESIVRFSRLHEVGLK